MLPRTERALLAVVLLVALLVRVAYVLALRESPYFEAPILDPAYHVDWARSLAAGQTFEEGPYFRAPLYPYLLGLVTALLGEGLLAPRLLQVLLGVATAYLTYRVGREAFSPREGLLAGASAATYWVLVYFDGELLLPTLATPLYLAALLATLRLRGAEATPRRLLLAGLLWGLGTITRPNVLLLAPVLGLWLWRRQALRAAAVFALGWLLPVLPVTAYNATVGGELTLVSTQGGVNFWIGNHPGADGHTAQVPGTTGTDFRATHVEARALAEREAGGALSHSEVSRHYAGKAWSFLLGSPGESIPLLTRKLGLFWQDAEIGNNQPVRGTVALHAPWLPWLSVPFWLLAPLGLVGLGLVLRRSELAPLTGFAVVFCLSVVAFFVCSRFRAPLLPVWMVLAAHACVWAVERWRGGARRGPLIALGMVALGAAASLATRADRDQAVSLGLGHAAVGYDLAGDPGRAATLHQRALSLAPEDVTLRLAYADHLEGAGDRAAALQEVRGVLEREPEQGLAVEKLLGLLHRSKRYPALLRESEALLARAGEHPGGHYYRGAALVGMGRASEALPSFRRARDLDPAGSRAAFVLGMLLASAGQEEPALASLEQAVANDHFPGARGQRIQAHQALARLLLRRGQVDRARQVAALLAAREPEAPEAKALLGEVGG